MPVNHHQISLQGRSNVSAFLPLPFLVPVYKAVTHCRPAESHLTQVTHVVWCFRISRGKPNSMIPTIRTCFFHVIWMLNKLMVNQSIFCCDLFYCCKWWFSVSFPLAWCVLIGHWNMKVFCCTTEIEKWKAYYESIWHFLVSYLFLYNHPVDETNTHRKNTVIRLLFFFTW